MTNGATQASEQASAAVSRQPDGRDSRRNKRVSAIMLSGASTAGATYTGSVRHWTEINSERRTADGQRSSGRAARYTISGRYWIAARCGTTPTKSHRNQGFMRNAHADTKPARCESVHRHTTQWSARA